MIELYTSDTPNGHKISIMLEEIGVPYRVKKIQLSLGEQKSPKFLKINPNGKIPAIIDKDTNQRVFESGAILIYLAEKSKKLLPRNPKARIETLEWLFFQMANIGPMMGQLWHFQGRKPKVRYAFERYRNEVLRIFGVVDGQLAKNHYLAGDTYTIADIAAWPWMRHHDALNIDLSPFLNVARWIAEVAKRPAAQKGITIPG